MHYDKQHDQSNLHLNRISSLRVSVTVLLWRLKLLGGSAAFMLPQEFLDFNFPKSSFLGFWVIQTWYWPVPFSSDEALQIGGLFPEGQFPRSGHGARRVQAIFQISTWKFFLLKTYLLRKIWQISDFSEYGVRRVQTVFQISMVEAGVNPRLLSYRTAYRPQRIFFKWNRSGSHCNRVGYHRKSWLSAFFWMFKRHMSSSKGSNVWITWYRVIYRTQTLLNTVQLWQLNRRIKTYQWHLRVFIATNITASLTDRRPITSRLNWPVRSISRV